MSIRRKYKIAKVTSKKTNAPLNKTRIGDYDMCLCIFCNNMFCCINLHKYICPHGDIGDQ